MTDHRSAGTAGTSASNSNCALRYPFDVCFIKLKDERSSSELQDSGSCRSMADSWFWTPRAESKLIAAGALCKWRPASFELFRDVLILMRDTGMRNERELYRIRVEHIDWFRKVIFVPDSKTPSGRREAPISNRIIPVLRARCASSEGWLFPSKRSRAAHLTNIGKLYRAARIKQVCRRSWCFIPADTISGPACCGKPGISPLR